MPANARRPVFHRIASPLPLFEAAQKRSDPRDADVSQFERHTGTRGFVGSGTVKDGLPIPREVTLLRYQLVRGHANCAGDLAGHYSAALAANASTAAMFCSNAGGSPCRSSRYAGLLYATQTLPALSSQTSFRCSHRGVCDCVGQRLEFEIGIVPLAVDEERRGSVDAAPHSAREVTADPVSEFARAQ